MKQNPKAKQQSPDHRLIERLKKLRTELAFGGDGEAASLVGEAIEALNIALTA